MKDIIDKVKKVRKELHNSPEHSGKEVKTREIIKSFLSNNTDLRVSEYNGGIIALYEQDSNADAMALGSDADTIALRVDIDAVSLPNGSAAHLCGHDGHSAVLLGVALMLDKIRPNRRVLLIFQPAEENGEGANAMAGLLKDYNVSEIYGSHNLPGYEFGKVFTSYDTFACASCGMIFNIKGKPAHAAYPESGASPMKAVNELFTAIDESQNGDRFSDGTLATLVGCKMGQKAFGTLAENAEVWITVRSDTEKDFKRIKEYLEYVVKKQCEYLDLSYTIEIMDEFPATVNDRDCAEKVIDKCEGTLLNKPMRWSEDFGHYLNYNGGWKGAFFGIGAGKCPDLHTEDYEYPDELLEYHINAFVNLI